jgi:hypothetical protein
VAQLFCELDHPAPELPDLFETDTVNFVGRNSGYRREVFQVGLV